MWLEAALVGVTYLALYGLISYWRRPERVDPEAEKPPVDEQPVTTLRNAAQELGFEPRGAVFQRRIDERIVLELSARKRSRQIGQVAKCRARIDPPLRSELRVKPYDGHRATDVRVQHDFDLRFIVITESPERAKSLLADGIDEAIIELGREGSRVELSEREVELTRSSTTELAEFRSLYAGARRLARLLVDADEKLRHVVPFAVAARVWLVAARSLGGSFDRERRALSASTAFGRLRGELCEMGGDRWSATARFELGRPISPEFSLADEPAPAGGFATGDAAFDRTFSVITEDESAITRVLDGDARARLVELRGRVTGISVTHDEIAVELDERVATDDDVLLETLQALLAAAEALAIVSGQGGLSAYR
jgi:hypothetical protein